MALIRYWTLSVAAGDGTEGDPYRSSVGDDFPVELGPAEIVLTDQKRSWGRDGDGNSLWIEGDVYRYEVITEGVKSQSDIMVIDRGGIQLAIAECDSVHTVTQAVHAHANHEVLAGTLHPDEDPDEVPQPILDALEQWAPNVSFTAGRWTRIKDFLVSRGVSEGILDSWAQDNPGATPTDFYKWIRKFIR